MSETRSPAACRHTRMLLHAALDPTENRLRVMKLLEALDRPASAPDLLSVLREHAPFDKVTLYRTLDLFTEHRLIEKHSAGDQTTRYCLMHSAQPHGHFYCKSCGTMECLPPEMLTPLLHLHNGCAGHDVHHIELRLDGICTTCKQKRS